MKGWYLTFDDESLDGAKNCKVEISHVEEGEIIAKVDGFEVMAPIVFHSPHYVSCNCKSKYPCKHEAALIYYLEEHPELLNGSQSEADLISSIDEYQLREFLKNEMKRNFQLKKDFLEEFGKESVIDKQYYVDKLNQVFRSGEDRYFADFGIYNIDMMEYGLSEFIDNELSKILEMREHSFACSLVEKIAEILGDDLAVSYDSWYGIVEDFMEYVYILEDSIYLTSNERKSLERATSEIVSYL